jgi:hypothetical protein
MQLAFQQSGAALHPIDEAVISAAISRTGRGGDAARLEWQALRRKLDRVDPTYKH